MKLVAGWIYEHTVRWGTTISPPNHKALIMSFEFSRFKESDQDRHQHPSRQRSERETFSLALDAGQ